MGGRGGVGVSESVSECGRKEMTRVYSLAITRAPLAVTNLSQVDPQVGEHAQQLVHR